MHTELLFYTYRVIDFVEAASARFVREQVPAHSLARSFLSRSRSVFTLNSTVSSLHHSRVGLSHFIGRTSSHRACYPMMQRLGIYNT